MTRTWLLLPFIFLLAACAQHDWLDSMSLPKNAYAVKEIKGQSFEDGLEFSIAVPANSYEPITLVERQMQASGFSACSKNQAQRWASNAGPSQMLARFYMNKGRSEFAVVRVEQTEKADGTAVQNFVVGTQLFTANEKNGNIINEFCGKA